MSRRGWMRTASIAMALACGPAVAQESKLHEAYQARWAPRLVPMLVEVVKFPTYAGNDAAFAAQKSWLQRTAKDLGFTFRDAGKVVEIELPAAPGAPVLGLVAHGDVVPAESGWAFPPFEAAVKDGMVRGRGVVDDKGPLVQALLAMKVIAESDRPRTHAIRLLVGSDEESGSTDMNEYLASNPAPDLSLVLDAYFPVVLGEKAWNLLTVEAPLTERTPGAYRLASLEAGLAANIVPDLAVARVEGPAGSGNVLEALRARIAARPVPPGIRVEASREGSALTLRVAGRAAHAGVNAEGGRNALMALAWLLTPELPPGGGRDVLAFALLAGQDLEGSALGLLESHPIFGRAVVVPTLARTTPEGVKLSINIRSNPGLSQERLKQRMEAQVRELNERTGGALKAGGYFESVPLTFDPEAKIVKRLLAAYERVTGRADKPVVSAGSTYAKKIPRSIAFGMWFPGKPYPGHDVDEMIAVADLHQGTRVLLEGLADLVFNEPINDPFKP